MIKTNKYYVRSLDPIHIGTGGYRLGRVDNTIIREPATNLPKIPGTSISGVSKFFVDLYFRDKGSKSSICASIGSEKLKEKAKENKNSIEQIGSCDAPNECPICSAYGYSNEKESRKGILNFSDIHILFFPVNSMFGPVWCISESNYNEFSGSELRFENEDCIISFENTSGKINLGWLMLPCRTDTNIKNKIKFEFINKVAVVKDKIYANIVNDNLEVRTSVAIDPQTGAGIDGALFTYEAIPAFTLLQTAVTQNDYNNNFNNLKLYSSSGINNYLDIFELSFSYLEAVGLGGMSTRGFGRVKFINKDGE